MAPGWPETALKSHLKVTSTRLRDLIVLKDLSLTDHRGSNDGKEVAHAGLGRRSMLSSSLATKGPSYPRFSPQRRSSRRSRTSLYCSILYYIIVYHMTLYYYFVLYRTISYHIILSYITYKRPRRSVSPLSAKPLTSAHISLNSGP